MDHHRSLGIGLLSGPTGGVSACFARLNRGCYYLNNHARYHAQEADNQVKSGPCFTQCIINQS